MDDKKPDLAGGKKLKISKVELMRRVGLRSYSTFLRYLNGTAKPGAATALKIDRESGGVYKKEVLREDLYGKGK